MTIRATISLVGASGLIIIGLLIGWYTTAESESRRLRAEFVKTDDQIDAAKFKVAELKDMYDDTLLKRDKLVKRAELLAKEESKSTRSITQLEAIVAKLANRMDAPRQVFRFLSYALSPLASDVTPAERKVLDTGLEPQRIALTELTMQSETLILKGEATDKRSVGAFVKRLKAAGYLHSVKLRSTTEQSEERFKTKYFSFLIEAKPAFPLTSRIDLQRGGK